MSETNPVEQLEPEQPLSYSVFIPNLTQPIKLISSTGDRYNTSVPQSLQIDSDRIQQKINPKTQTGSNNFFRDSKWSPDGSHLLTNSADDVLRLFQLPTNVYEDVENSDQVLPMEPLLGIREGESIYDFAWYPSMTAQDPSTCCFITSVRDHPIQLWDMTTGTVRASYRAIDHCERFIGPNVLSFNPDGSKIFCGYENMIEIFDSQTGSSSKHPTLPTRRSKTGQKGILSCLDFSPDQLYAVGSYSQSIGIYDELNHELCLKLMADSGLSQVRFSPDGLYLFSACRQSNEIVCWDIRETAEVLYRLPRPGKTNQRIQFDLDSTGKYLVTGDSEGNVLVYDVQSGLDINERLVYSDKLHEDIVSSARFNPVYPVLSTCSGQRKFNLNDDSDDEEEEVKIDNTLKTWRVQGQYEWFAYPTTQE